MSADLAGACAQFEQLVLASLLPRSIFHPGFTAEDTGLPFGGADRDLFAQAFAAAFERAGGLGLTRELLSDLGEKP
jgi:hypothetical protein